MKFDDLKLARIIIEIRYENAYTLWDKCGTLWDSVSKIWPGVQSTTIEPNRQSFRLEDKLELSTEINKAFIISHYCKVKDVIDDMSTFIEVVREKLEINLYTRVGARFIFEKSCKDKKEQNLLISSIGFINTPKNELFDIPGDNHQTEFTFKRDGEDIGARIKITSAVKKIEANKPIGAPDYTISDYESHVVIYDVDYYTKKSVKPGQLKVDEWMKHINHVVRRDSKVLFGE